MIDPDIAALLPDFSSRKQVGKEYTTQWNARGHRFVVYPYVKPYNPKTILQQCTREALAILMQEWYNLSDAEKQTYQNMAEGKKVFPYNLYIRANFNRAYQDCIQKSQIAKLMFPHDNLIPGGNPADNNPTGWTSFGSQAIIQTLSPPDPAGNAYQISVPSAGGTDLISAPFFLTPIYPVIFIATIWINDWTIDPTFQMIPDNSAAMPAVTPPQTISFTHAPEFKTIFAAYYHNYQYPLMRAKLLFGSQGTTASPYVFMVYMTSKLDLANYPFSAQFFTSGSQTFSGSAISNTSNSPVPITLPNQSGLIVQMITADITGSFSVSNATITVTTPDGSQQLYTGINIATNADLNLVPDHIPPGSSVKIVAGSSSGTGVLTLHLHTNASSFAPSLL